MVGIIKAGAILNDLQTQADIKIEPLGQMRGGAYKQKVVKGTSPLEVSVLAGQYCVIASKEGFSGMRSYIEVHDGETKTVNFRLFPKTETNIPFYDTIFIHPADRKKVSDKKWRR